MKCTLEYQSGADRAFPEVTGQDMEITPVMTLAEIVEAVKATAVVQTHELGAGPQTLWIVNMKYPPASDWSSISGKDIIVQKVIDKEVSLQQIAIKIVDAMKKYWKLYGGAQ